jgi:hypothetical protein
MDDDISSVAALIPRSLTNSRGGRCGQTVENE